MSQPQRHGAGSEATAGPLTMGQRFEAATLRTGCAVLSALPRALVLASARLVGRAAFHVLRGRRAVALANVTATLGRDLSPGARRRLVRLSFGHAAAMGADLATLRTVAQDPRRWCDVSEADLQALRQARSRGRGVLLVASHFGLMESMGVLLGHEGFQVSFVAKRFDNPVVDAEVNALRGLTGNVVIHKGGAKPRILDTLARGGLVAIVVDQHPGPHDRAWIPLFGLEAATSRSIGSIARESGAPLVPIHSFPLAGGRARCELGPVIEPPPPGSGPEATDAVLREIMAAMEAAECRMPEAWLWLHRRWKVHRDAAGESSYPSYSVSESEERLKNARSPSRSSKRRAGAAAP